MSDKAMKQLTQNSVAEQYGQAQQYAGLPSAPVENGVSQQLEFVAQTEVGEIGISVTGHDHAYSDISPLHSRLELSRLERAVRALEDWLGLSLDLELASVPLCAPHIVSMEMAGKTPRQIAVHLPIKSWPTGADTLDAFERCGLQLDWPICSSRLMLAELNLSAEDQSLLQKNATVLIPESYSPDWTPSLEIPALGALIEGQFDIPSVAWSAIANAVPVMPSDEQEGQVLADSRSQLFCYSSITTRMCLQNADPLSNCVNRKMDESGCLLQATDDLEVSGVLMPVGRGVGLHVTGLSKNNSR